jgi:coenzyme F420-0:L-glutamate ligase/coenzyme F420-1:gamma-L-glutamate ligase
MRKPAKHTSREAATAERPSQLQILPVPGLPEIRKGDNLADELIGAMRRAVMALAHGDVVVIAQKIVSKAEGRVVRLAKFKPSPKAERLAAKLKKDPRLVEAILRESRRIVRSDPVLIVETHHGFVCANAGVDQSNLPGSDVVSLLPQDPDGSARRLAESLRRRIRRRVAVIISDTFGRPWRLGLTNVAIGAAGVPALLDLRGERDLHGRSLHATVIAVADELASAAGLVMGKADGVPAVIVRGYRHRSVIEPAARIIRPAKEDLFR